MSEFGGGVQVGFRTASGREAVVPEEALRAAQRLLADSQVPAESAPVGFSTASGKPTSIGADALEKARHLFSDTNAASATERPSFSGFATGRGAAVAVSRGSVQAAKRLFEDTPVDTKRRRPPTDEALFGKDFENRDPSPKVGFVDSAIRRVPSVSTPSPAASYVYLYTTPTAAPPLQRTSLSSALRSNAIYQSVSADPLPTPPTSPVFHSSARRAASFSVPTAAAPSTRDPCATTPTSHVEPKGRFVRRRRSASERRVVPANGQLRQLRVGGQRLGMRDGLLGQQPSSYSREQLLSYGVRPALLDVNAASSADFVFTPDFFEDAEAAALTCGDGVSVCRRPDGSVTPEDVFAGFQMLSSVDARLISQAWLRNHYRWIVWKLAALEAAFPLFFARRQLTLDRVCYQLKYRYDREIDAAQRSALHRVIEGDDSLARPVILCVCAVVPRAAEAKLELTDGWYSLPATLDPILSSLVERGRITVGSKLFIAGAVLEGGDNGYPPLEKPDSMHMALEANSVRTARWDARLGFCRQRHPPSFPIASLLPGGGGVRCARLLVCRGYPVVFVEKQPNGQLTYRSARQEERAATAFEERRAAAIERLLDDVRARVAPDCTSQATGLDSADSQESQTEDWETGEGLFRQMKRASDLTDFQRRLGETERRLLDAYCQKRRDRKQDDMRQAFEVELVERRDDLPRRRVDSQMRLRVVDLGVAGRRADHAVFLTVYGADEDATRQLVEGRAFCVHGLQVGASRRADAAGEPSRAHLLTTRRTRFERIAHAADELWTRECSDLARLKTAAAAPLFGEVDFVAAVISVRTELTYEIAYVADERFNFVAIRFGGSLSSFGLEDVVVTGNFIAAASVKWSGASQPSKVPYYNFILGTTEICSNPKSAVLNDRLSLLKSHVCASADYFGSAFKQLQVVQGAKRR